MCVYVSKQWGLQLCQRYPNDATLSLELKRASVHVFPSWTFAPLYLPPRESAWCFILHECFICCLPPLLLFHPSFFSVLIDLRIKSICQQLLLSSKAPTPSPHLPFRRELISPCLHERVHWLEKFGCVQSTFYCSLSHATLCLLMKPSTVHCRCHSRHNAIVANLSSGDYLYRALYIDLRHLLHLPSSFTQDINQACAA